MASFSINDMPLGIPITIFGALFSVLVHTMVIWVGVHEQFRKKAEAVAPDSDDAKRGFRHRRVVVKGTGNTRRGEFAVSANLYAGQQPSRGEVVVFCHGFNTASFVFGDRSKGLVSLARADASAVITYDHHGRGASDHPDPGYAARFDTGEYLQVLTAVLDAFPESRQRKVVLVGYSFGGAIVTAFAAANPNRVQALGLIAPAGLMDEPADISYKLSKIPILGAYGFRLVYPAMAGHEVKSTPRSDDPAATTNTLAVDWYRYANLKGYYPALYATLQNFPVFYHKQNKFEDVGNSKISTTCVWGTDDEVLSYTLGVGRLKLHVPQAKVVALHGAKHDIAGSRPTDCWNALRGLVACQCVEAP